MNNNLFKKVKERLIRKPYAISIEEDGILIRSLFGLRKASIKWDDIDLINTWHPYPGPGIKLEILYQDRKILPLFDNMPAWDDVLKGLSEKLPSFSMAAVQDAQEDMYEQLHLCWEKPNSSGKNNIID